MFSSVLFLFVIIRAHSQECVQNLPRFADQGGGSERFESGTQAIIPDYFFDCYGNVTQWGAFVERPGRREMYTLDFQVWRRSGGGQGTTGEYDFVGSNRFSQIGPGMGGEILETVSVERQIEVRPGDVIGFYVLGRQNDDGVELQRDNRPPGGRVVVTAWFTTSAASTIPTSIRVRTSDTRSGDLHSSTTAAPIITAMVALSPSLIPAPSPTPFPSHTPSLSPTLYPSSTPPLSSISSPSSPSSLPESVLASSSTVLPLLFMITQTGTSQTTQTSLTQAPVQLSTSSIPQPSLFLPPPPDTTSSPVGSGLPVGAIVAIVIVVLIVVVLVFVLVFVLALALRRRSKKQVLTVNSLDNPEYSVQPSEANSSSISRLLPAKPPPPQPKPKAHVNAYAVTGPQAYEFPEPNYHSIPSKPAEYETFISTSSNTALYEPVYADADTSGKETAAKTHVYHSVEPHGASDQEQYYSDPTSPSQPPDLAPPTHMYHILDSHENSGQAPTHYEEATLSAYQMQGVDALDQVGIYVPTQEQRAAFGTRYEVPETNLYNQLKFFTEDTTYWAPASTTSGLYSQLAAKKYREIPRNQIRLLEKLGSGQFGQVCKGLWKFSGCTMEIAVKTLKLNTTEEDRVKFLQEAAIMGQFNHPNVVKLYGVVTVGEPAMIGLEIMTNGDLRGYLNGLNLRQYPDQSELQSMFVRFAREVAAGMTYLSRKSFVHRDLAARNILLNQSLTCKIGDFGMARNLIDDTYYKSSGGKIPVKWTSPEALLYKKYTTASDVWSYGMVLFEIWSVGYKPFHNLSNSEVIRLVNTGHCEPPPPGCPRAIYTLMVECWNPNHQERISFNYISDYLRQSDETLTYWSQEDKSVSPKAHVLGAALHSSERLYLDLQCRYK